MMGRLQRTGMARLSVDIGSGVCKAYLRKPSGEPEEMSNMHLNI